MKERISHEECVRLYKVEISFLEALEESGLIHPQIENDIKYIFYEELSMLEKYMNLHYDLEVNLPGIEVIHHLLQKVAALQEQNQRLTQKLFFETDQFFEI
ncbi:MAG: MerR family transcriptional regulator [Flavobacteriaceae bacterium]|nr:MerR family transcriptional regulator [Flavobacteriaceae bacterium]